MLLPNNGTLPNTNCWIDFDTISLVITTTETTYTLSYNANGGSGAPSSQSITTTTGSATFTVSSVAPIKENHEFLGWAATSTVTSPSYYGGSSITISSSTTLYAVWKTTTVPITFRFGSNETPDIVVDAPVGTTYSLEPTSAAKFGYVFMGWVQSPGLYGTAMQEAVQGGTFWNYYSHTSSLVFATAAKTWYAVWQANAPSNVFAKDGEGESKGKYNGLR